MNRPPLPPPEFPPLDWRTVDAGALLQRIDQAEVIGMGGGGFPTAVKLRIAQGHPPTRLVLNGGATEFDFSPDPALLSEYGDAVLEGTCIARKIIEPETAVLALARSAATLELERWSAVGVRIFQLNGRYPEGEERSLLRQVLGVDLPSGSYPAEFGIGVLNVATAFAVSEAVTLGHRPTDRLVSVNGECRWLKFGERVDSITETDGGIRMGGPLSGIPGSGESTVSARTFAISADRFGSPLPCIRCGACTLSCPLNLPVERLYEEAVGRTVGRVAAEHLLSCYECGACNDACPSEIPILDALRAANLQLAAAQESQRNAQRSRHRFERRQRRLDARGQSIQSGRDWRMHQHHAWEGES